MKQQNFDDLVCKAMRNCDTDRIGGELERLLFTAHYEGILEGLDVAVTACYQVISEHTKASLWTDKDVQSKCHSVTSKKNFEEFARCLNNAKVKIEKTTRKDKS